MSYIIVSENSNLAHEFSTFSCLAVPKPFQKLYNFYIIVMYYITGVPDFIGWALNKVICTFVYNRSEPCTEPWLEGRLWLVHPFLGEQFHECCVSTWSGMRRKRILISYFTQVSVLGNLELTFIVR